MVQDTEGCGLYFPIRLRCATVADALTNPELEDALTRALGRAFTHARAALPTATAIGDGVALQPPQLMKGDLSTNDATALLARVSRAIEAAARAQALPLSKPPLAHAEIQAIDVSEPFDPQRYDPTTATYDIPSYSGGRRKVPLRETSNPFARLLKLFERNIVVFSDLLTSLNNLKDPNGNRVYQLDNLWKAFNDILGERQATRLVADVYMGRLRPKDVPQDQLNLANAVFDLYHVKGSPFPVRAHITQREGQLERGIVLVAIVRAHMTELDGRANGITSAAWDILRHTIMDLGSDYLELLTVPQHEAFARLAFLETFYRDPQRVTAYAVVRFVRQHLPELYRNLQQVSFSAGGGIVISGTRLEELHFYSSFQLSEMEKLLGHQLSNRVLTLAGAINLVVELRETVEQLGDLPKVEQGVRTVPSGRIANVLSAEFAHLQAVIAILALWQPIDGLDDLLETHPNIGKDFVEGERYSIQVGMSAVDIDLRSDRRRWLEDLSYLEHAFTDEVKRTTHPGIEENTQRWQRTVQTLLDEIRPAARRADIVASIIMQIPALFVGGVIVSGVGAWIEAVTNGSRLLIILAEGTTLTLFTALTAGPGARPTTVLGWVAQFELNLLLAGIGQFFRSIKVGADAVEQLANNRRVVLELSLAAGAFTATTFVQTAAQSIEKHARSQGGESGFTEMLTINLIMNALGLFVGAALPRPEQTGRGSTLVKLTPAQIVTEIQRTRGVTLDEGAARQWLELADRADDFQTRFEALNEDAKQGTLDRKQFDTWRREGLDLADELRKKLPQLAEALGTGHTREQIQAFVSKLQDALTHLEYPTGHPEIVLLVEFTPGLERVGNDITWIYDPARSPAGLERLLQSYRQRDHRNYEVRQLSTGGWKIVNRESGQTVLQLLPLALQRVGGGATWTYDATHPSPSLEILLNSFSKNPDYTVREPISGGWVITKDGRTALQLLPVAPETVRLLPPSLEVLAGGPQTKTRGGLNNVRTQSSVPQLESELAHAAAKFSSESVVRVLQAVELIDPSNRDAWRGLSNYLKLNGDTEVLATALTFRNPQEAGINRRLLVDAVLRQIGDWDALAIRGLEALYRIRARTTGERLANFFYLEPTDIKSSLQNLSMIADRSLPGGLSRVLASLTSQDISQVRGAVGALKAGAKLAGEYPGATLSFEVPVFSESGFLRRVQDINVLRLETTVVAGRQQTNLVTLATFEIKYVSTTNLGSRAPHQLAIDIALDAFARSQRPAPGAELAGTEGGARPFFETFGWRIRREELEGTAIERLKSRGILNPEGEVVDPKVKKAEVIDQEMREIVKDQLRDAFKDPALKSLDKAELEGYRNAFEHGIRFVDFF